MAGLSAASVNQKDESSPESGKDDQKSMMVQSGLPFLWLNEHNGQNHSSFALTQHVQYLDASRSASPSSTSLAGTRISSHRRLRVLRTEVR